MCYTAARKCCCCDTSHEQYTPACIASRRCQDPRAVHSGAQGSAFQQRMAMPQCTASENVAAAAYSDLIQKACAYAVQPSYANIAAQLLDRMNGISWAGCSAFSLLVHHECGAIRFTLVPLFMVVAHQCRFMWRLPVPHIGFLRPQKPVPLCANNGTAAVKLYV